MARKIFVAKTNSDLERCFPVIQELRPLLNYLDFLTIYEHAHKNDQYKIIAIEEEEKIIAVMGIRILYDLVRGKHVYIDDLVTSENSRSRGLGAILLNYAESFASDENCSTLRLCTGLENQKGMHFYEKNGWVQRAVAYTKKLK